MKNLHFNTIQEAQQYCAGITDWEFANNITWEQLVKTVYDNDCCIACALEILGEKASHYSVHCECNSGAK